MIYVLVCTAEPVEGVCLPEHQQFVPLVPSLADWHAHLPWVFLMLLTAWSLRLIVRQLLNRR